METFAIALDCAEFAELCAAYDTAAELAAELANNAELAAALAELPRVKRRDG